MPEVHNGIGTWYYGKQHVHRIKGGCRHCKRIGELESYDTTLYFVFFMIPIIPLKKKRILEQCPFCSMHQVVDLKKWQAGKEQAIADILEKLRQDPDNRESILEALGMATYFQDEPLFQKLATLAVGRTDDAQIQAALGAAYSYFSRREEAIEAFKHSLRAEDKPEVRQELAMNLLRMGDPNQAEPLLRHIWENKTEEEIGYVQLLIEAYQSQGKHEQALAVMDQRDAAFPEFAKQKEVQKQRQTSEKYRLSGKPVKAANLTDSSRSGYQEGNSTKAKLARLAFPLILLAILAFYVGTAIWIGENQKVYFVNGTNRAYKVSINGTEQDLPADTATLVRIPQGEVVVESQDPAVPFEPLRCTVHTGFWGRPFDDTVIVINPDRSAWIVEEKNVYAENPPPDSPPTYHFGQGFYHLPDANYVFEDFPIQIQVKGNDEVTKTRIGMERGVSPLQRLNLLGQSQAPLGEQISYIKQLLNQTPTDSPYVYWLTSRLSPEEMIDLLKSRLDQKPLLIDWHRVYQSLMEKTHPEHDLRAEYEKRLNELSDPDAQYLLARVSDDVEAEKLLLQAAKAAPPSAYALRSLGYRAMAKGQFEEAVEWSSKAIQAAPHNMGFQKIYRDALWASKKYDQLQNMPLQFTMGNLMGTRMEEIRIAVAKGDLPTAETLRSQILKQLNQQPVPDTLRKSIQANVDATIASLKGDGPGYIKAMELLPGDRPFIVLFLQDQLEQAAKTLVENKAQTPSQRDEVLALVDHALIYLAARQTNQKELAEKEWPILLDLLIKHGRDERQLADMLSGKKPFDVHKVRNASIDTDHKRLVLLLFAERFPQAKTELVALANKLNFQKDPVSLCIQKILPTK